MTGQDFHCLLLRLKSRSARGTFALQLLWEIAQTLVTHASLVYVLDVPRLYECVYKISSLANIELKILQCLWLACGLLIQCIPIRFSWVISFQFSFYEIRIGKQRGIKFVILVELSDTGGPFSITVTIEYLFALQLWCCGLSVRSQWGGGKKHYC